MKLATIMSLLLALAPSAGAAEKKATVKETCGNHIKLVVHLRSVTWQAENDLQVSHTMAGYKPGHRTRSCQNVYQHLRNWKARARHRSAEVRYLNTNVRAAIMWAFGPSEGPGAIVVSNCESGSLLDNWSSWLRASNGQFLGGFQMGTSERSRYAIFKGVYRYDTVIDQVRAAARMQADEGWSPWQCRPEGGLRW